MFRNNLSETRDDIKERMQENKEIEISDEDEKDVQHATQCFICGDKFKKT